MYMFGNETPVNVKNILNLSNFPFRVFEAELYLTDLDTLYKLQILLGF